MGAEMNTDQNGSHMSPNSQMARFGEDGEVGYRRPPRAHQFQPGQSGNPKGRPKGAKGEATILGELLSCKIAIREGGKLRKVTLLEAILTRMAEDSLKGNVKTAAFLLNRFSVLVSGEVGHVGLGEDDKAVLDAFIRDVQAQAASREAENDPQ